MHKIKLLFTFALLIVGTALFAQKEKTVSIIKEGTKINSSDIGFLAMVANEKVEAGMKDRKATIKGVTYKEGHTITKAEAKDLNEAITAWQKTYKAPDKSRGATGLCYYWYYYCDGYGYCYWYKYYYYC
jgi:hypothetical protein